MYTAAAHHLMLLSGGILFCSSLYMKKQSRTGVCANLHRFTCTSKYIYLGVKNDTFFFPSETSYQVPGTRYGTWCIRSILDFNRYCGGTESTWENLGSLYCGRCHTRSSLGFNTGEYLQYSEVFQGSVRGGQPNAGSISSVRTASTASTRSTEILSACEVYSGV